MSSNNGNGEMNETPGVSKEAWVRPAGAGEVDDGTSLIRALLVLRRRGWILLLVWGLVFALAAFFSFTRPRVYRAEATLEVGPDRPAVSPDLAGDPVGGNSQLWENHFRTQESLLRRPGLLSKVLEALPSEMAAPYLKAPDPVRRLSEDLEIDTVPSTFLIRISLDHPHPDQGPKIVNTLVSLFIEDSNRRIRELKNGTLEILNTEALPVIRQKVEESEKLLQAFQAKTGFGDLEAGYASLLESKRRLDARLSDLRLRRVLLHSERGTPEEVAAEDPSFLSRTAREGAKTLEALVSHRTTLELELAQLSATHKEKHPAVVALREQLERVNECIRKAVRAAIQGRDRELSAVELEEQALVEEEKDLDQQISAARVRLAQHKKLEAEVAASWELYNSYLKKQGEVKATSGAGMASVRVVDLAKAAKEYSKKTRLLLSLGAILGLLLGVMAILVVEQIDDRIATPRQAETALGLDLLTVVPRMTPAPEEKNQPLIPEDDPLTAPLEAFRRLRTELVTRLRGGQGAKLVAVVSPNYGEGKSTVAINLARVLALEGRRVLLFDADLRRPRLKGFLADEHAPGLEEYLRGMNSLTRSLQASRIQGVQVIGAEWEMEGAAEVPGSPRFRTVWEMVRPHYDFVIVDAGPVNAASEVAVVANYADASLMVVEERRTGIREALAAKRRLLNHQVRLLGLIVNRSLTRLSRRPDPEGFLVDLDSGDLEKSTFVEIDPALIRNENLR